MKELPLPFKHIIVFVFLELQGLVEMSDVLWSEFLTLLSAVRIAVVAIFEILKDLLCFTL